MHGNLWNALDEQLITEWVMEEVAPMGEGEVVEGVEIFTAVRDILTGFLTELSDKSLFESLVDDLGNGVARELRRRVEVRW